MNKIALITTTINVPKVLKLYAAYGPQVKMFIAGDKKTPDEAIDFCDSLGGVNTEDAVYIGWGRQSKLGYECSELIGWNCIQRRNIALLEALKWGADIIVSVDDDNIPMNNAYFENFARCFFETNLTAVPPMGYVQQVDVPRLFSGLQVSSEQGWFDVGQLLEPKARHRGFPIDIVPTLTFDSVTDAQIGVAAGACLGDPDTDCVTRMVQHPSVHGVSEALRSGVCVRPDTWTVYNSQNVAFLRELAPAMFMVPHLQRYDDIVASLITQAVMRDRNMRVHFGKPYTFQQRNIHRPLSDLDAERWGMEHIRKFAEYLGKNPVEGRPILQWLRWLYDDLLACTWWPQEASLAGLAWCNDCEKVI